MSFRPAHLLRLIAVTLIALLLVPNAPVRAAQATDPIRSNGSLAPGETFTTPIYMPGPANLRLAVSGGVEGDSITMTVARGSTEVGKWSVRSGETTWGYANLPEGGSLTLVNTSTKNLNYTLVGYARGSAPGIASDLTTWSGVARGNGTRSTIQLDVTRAGRYRFTLGAASGSYQIRVDNDYLVKTVVSGNAPKPEDTTYYLSAGVHSFTIRQNSNAPLTEWSMALAFVGGDDPVPSNEASPAVFGGPQAFREEWIPLQITKAAPVNVRVAAVGATADRLVFELYNNGKKVYTSANIYGGEVAWGSSALVAGANAMRVVAADNNAAPLAYTVTVAEVPRVQYGWSGTTYGKPAHTTDGRPTIRLTFPKDGLYRFKLNAAAGRYQLLLNSKYLQKIVTDAAASEFTAYVPAGTHTLVIAQDPAKTRTNWSVDIAPVAATSDSLTFGRAGVTLGGTGNAFREEWLPLQIAAGRKVNLRVVARGAATDALQIELYNGRNRTYNAARVYGGEVFWATSGLTEGTNFLRIVAADANVGEMDYRVEVYELHNIPTSIKGVTRNNGLNSVVQVNAPVSGVYDITLKVSQGAGQILINRPANATNEMELNGTNTTLRVALRAGTHTFLWRQDPRHPVTTWEIGTVLRQQGVVGANTVYMPMATRRR